MELIKRIVKHGSFSEEELKFIISLLNKDAYPQYYIPHNGTTNSLPKGLKFKETILASSSTFVRTGAGSRQPTRKNGINPDISKLAHSISVGYNLGLTDKPISAVSINGQLIELNGRTRNKILIDDYKHKNVPVNVYEFTGEYVNSTKLQDDAIDDFGLLLNQPVVSSPNLMDDWVDIGKKKIDRGTLEANYDSIESWLKTNATCFTSKKITTMASTIYQERGNINAGLQLIAWSDKQGENWLNLNGYKNTKDILYYVVSSEMVSKAIFNSASLAQKNPGKEIHIILHTGRLEGKDVAKSYVDKVLDFIDDYYLKLSQASFGFFAGKQPTDSPIKLVGALPANVFNLCEDDGELIIFGVNDQKLIDYKENNTSSSLNKFFELDSIINEN
jgi:hypothetical protein